MTQPADFAEHLAGANRHDWTVWLILADCLADYGFWDDAQELRQTILKGEAPDQLNTSEEYILVLPSGYVIRISKRLSSDDLA